MTTTFRPSTSGQHAFIKSLVADRVLTPGASAAVDQARAAAVAGRFSAKAASSLIDLLKTMPYGTPKAQAEPGYYVSGDTAIKVQQNKAKTGTYALVWSGSSWDYAPGVAAHLTGMTPMTGEQAAALGLQSGHCIACCKPLGGETLTARVAATIGYGEICAGRHGWSFPKGAKAQRDYLAAVSA